jgi:outer membrane protein assembly factor BamA
MAYGAAGSYIFRWPGSGADDRPSTLSPILIYTQEKQFFAQLKSVVYLKDESYLAELNFKLQDYPDKFFGIGPGAATTDRESYTSRSSSLAFTLQKKIRESLNIGIQYNYTQWKITDYESDSLLSSGTIPGSREGMLSGLNLIANLDTRDNIFAPGRGEWFVFNARFYNKVLGSDFNFNSLSIDLRKYFPLFSSHVLALRTVVRSQSGTVPFQELARLGGQYLMRGYYDGRFRDRNLAALQLEYRLPLFWRLGMVGFASAGNVADHWSRFDFNHLKYSYGFGFRYVFDRKEKIYIRIDFGFGKDESGFYLSVFEAF